MKEFCEKYFKSFLFFGKIKFGSFWSLKIGTGAHEPEKRPDFNFEKHFPFLAPQASRKPC